MLELEMTMSELVTLGWAMPPPAGIMDHHQTLCHEGDATTQAEKLQPGDGGRRGEGKLCCRYNPMSCLAPCLLGMTTIQRGYKLITPTLIALCAE